MVPHQQGRSNRHGFPNVALQRLPRQRLTPALALEQPPAMSEEEFNGFFELHFKTAVRNQGKFNSCWAVQTANLIEENSKLNGAVVGQRWRLSAQALINCLPAVYDNGKHLRIWSRSEEEDCYMCSTHDALHFVQYRGMAFESDFRYVGSYQRFQPYACAGFISDYFEIKLTWEDSVIAEVLRRYGFLIGTFIWSGDFDLFKGGDMIWSGGMSEEDLQALREAQLEVDEQDDDDDDMEDEEEPIVEDGVEQERNHTVLITGVGCVGGISYFKVKNCMGRRFGVNGCCLIDKRLFLVVQGIVGAKIDPDFNDLHEDFRRLL